MFRTYCLFRLELNFICFYGVLLEFEKRMSVNVQEINSKFWIMGRIMEGAMTYLPFSSMQTTQGVDFSRLSVPPKKTTSKLSVSDKLICSISPKISRILSANPNFSIFSRAISKSSSSLSTAVTSQPSCANSIIETLPCQARFRSREQAVRYSSCFTSIVSLMEWI